MTTPHDQIPDGDWNFVVELMGAVEKCQRIIDQMGMMVDKLTQANDEINR